MIRENLCKFLTIKFLAREVNMPCMRSKHSEQLTFFLRSLNLAFLIKPQYLHFWLFLNKYISIKKKSHIYAI